MVTLRASWNGIDQAVVRISRLRTRIEDMRPYWPLIAEKFYKIEQRAFSSEGAVSRHGMWARLNARYKAWKDLHYPGRRVLTLRGSLRDTLTRAGHPQAIYEATPRSLTLGSRVPYAIYHQTGTGKMPARRPIDLSAREYAEIAREIHRLLVAEFSRAA